MADIMKRNECFFCKEEILSSPLISNLKRRKYCSSRCRTLSQQKRDQSHYPGLNTNDSGTVNELRCAADLFTKSYHVFRALSPSAPCDLIAIKGKKILRIQVRVGSYYSSGGVRCSKEQKDEGNYDHYGIVLKDSIVYDPPLE